MCRIAVLCVLSLVVFSSYIVPSSADRCRWYNHGVPQYTFCDFGCCWDYIYPCCSDPAPDYPDDDGTPTWQIATYSGGGFFGFLCTILFLRLCIRAMTASSRTRTTVVRTTTRCDLTRRDYGQATAAPGTRVVHRPKNVPGPKVQQGAGATNIPISTVQQSVQQVNEQIQRNQQLTGSQQRQQPSAPPSAVFQPPPAAVFQPPPRYSEVPNNQAPPKYTPSQKY